MAFKPSNATTSESPLSNFDSFSMNERLSSTDSEESGFDKPVPFNYSQSSCQGVQTYDPWQQNKGSIQENCVTKRLEVIDQTKGKDDPREARLNPTKQ